MQEAAQNMAKSEIVKLFCQISFLFIIFFPIYYAFKKKINDVLMAKFPMTYDEATFLQLNKAMVVGAAKEKSTINYEAIVPAN